MTVRISFGLLSQSREAPVMELSAHLVFKGGSMGDSPVKVHELHQGIEHDVVIHEALGLVLHRGEAELRQVEVTHVDTCIPRWLELIWIALDGSTSTELRRSRIRPGGTEIVTLDVADVVVIRELPYGVEGLPE